MVPYRSAKVGVLVVCVWGGSLLLSTTKIADVCTAIVLSFCIMQRCYPGCTVTLSSSRGRSLSRDSMNSSCWNLPPMSLRVDCTGNSSS